MKWLRHLWRVTLSNRLRVIMIVGWSLGGLMLLYQSSFFESRDWVFAHLSNNQSNYITNSLFSVKIIVISFSIFLFGSSYSSKSLSLHVNTFQIEKDFSSFLIAKLIVNVVLCCLFHFLYWSLRVLIGSLVLDISTEASMIPIGLAILQEALLFGWFSAIWMMWIQHPMSNILGITVFWGLEIMTSSNELWRDRISEIYPVVSNNSAGVIIEGDLRHSLILALGLFVLLYVYANRFRRDVSNREE